MLIDIRQLKFIHKDLRTVLLFVEKETGLNFTVTSLFRIKDLGVHGTLPLRGTDFRMRNKKVGEVIAEVVNEKFTYDPERPNKVCAYLHGKGSNLHLHFQVHPNTIKNQG